MTRDVRKVAEGDRRRTTQLMGRRHRRRIRFLLHESLGRGGGGSGLRRLRSEAAVRARIPDWTFRSFSTSVPGEISKWSSLLPPRAYIRTPVVLAAVPGKIIIIIIHLLFPSSRVYINADAPASVCIPTRNAIHTAAAAAGRY